MTGLSKDKHVALVALIEWFYIHSGSVSQAPPQLSPSELQEQINVSEMEPTRSRQ